LAEINQELDPYRRLPVLAQDYHSMGRKTESDAVLARFIEEQNQSGAYKIAQIHAYRGEADRAFEWLEIAYDQRDGGLFLTKSDPFLLRLKNDPRYDAFLKKMRLG